jgi:GNAT superfamily N-acetyltransferase
VTLPADVVLRPVVPGDEGLVAHYVRELAAYEKLADHAVATPAHFRRALFEAPARLSALIVERAGTPIGFAVWYYNFSTFSGLPGLYLEDIFVEPAARNLGIGREIFRSLARTALAEGCVKMNWAVLNWNAPSIAFYRGLGAQGMDDWTTQHLDGAALAALAG